ncbi:cellulase family glycosylhydrolase [Gracilimonas amylolytica]|uniref:cellulase family glycosylhydrolase n=1 Tax=Gracilimonas amylolytica TaxID=1749045 RepID=UPI000CD7E373|nr:cellulase family glycosylhydrolase [Gracilimonas amylolytica]
MSYLREIFILFRFFLVTALITLTLVNDVQAQKTEFLKGVNLAGAEFGEGNLPGNYGSDYIYPNEEEIDYFTDKGMNVFRIGFRWERLQREQFAELHQTELSRMNSIVNYATAKGAYVLLNPHNYSRYYGEVVGQGGVPREAFADFWAKVAEVYKDNPYVMFGLVNEPHDMSTEVWRDNANAAIAAIRETGAENLITVPGNGWTGAHSWNDNWYGTPNTEAMLEITDPIDNIAFEVHQYLDSNSSGASQTCVNSTIGAQRLEGFTEWLREHDKVGFLAEFGAASNSTCNAAITDMLEYLEDNKDVYMAWTWWAAGPWWGNSYFLSIEPYSNGDDKPQMALLEPYLDGAVSTSLGNDETLPTEISLKQNYPNPFNPTTQITYSLTEPAEVTLTIFNSLGQEVAQIINSRQAAGTYTVPFNGDNLTSGLYMYRLQTNAQTITRKMMLIK